MCFNALCGERCLVAALEISWKREDVFQGHNMTIVKIHVHRLTLGHTASHTVIRSSGVSWLYAWWLSVSTFQQAAEWLQIE